MACHDNTEVGKMHQYNDMCNTAQNYNFSLLLLLLPLPSPPPPPPLPSSSSSSVRQAYVTNSTSIYTLLLHETASAFIPLRSAFGQQNLCGTFLVFPYSQLPFPHIMYMWIHMTLLNLTTAKSYS